MKSAITSFTEEPYSYRRGNLITEYKAEIEIEVELIVNGEIKLRKKMKRHRLFTATSTAAQMMQFDHNRKTAIDKIAIDLAEDVYTQVTESF